MNPEKYDNLKTPQTDARRALIALGLVRKGGRISKNTKYLVARQQASYIPDLKRRGLKAQKGQ